MLNEIEFNECQFKMGDLNEDDNINVIDIISIIGILLN